MLELQKRKCDLADSILGGDERLITELKREDLELLLSQLLRAGPALQFADELGVFGAADAELGGPEPRAHAFKLLSVDIRIGSFPASRRSRPLVTSTMHVSLQALSVLE